MSQLGTTVPLGQMVVQLGLGAMARCVDFLQDEGKKKNSPYYGKVGEAAGAMGWSAGGSRAINAVAHPEGRQKFSALIALVPCNRACSEPIGGIPGTEICIYGRFMSSLILNERMK